MTDFRTRIRTSLANEALQTALDANAERRTRGRLTAFESLPDWRARRQQAHAVRAEVIAHLEQYLEQFLEKAEQNGILVHRAKDGAEAVKTIIDIVGAGSCPLPQKLIAKAKSMVSEEIDLNPALEAAGIRVVETDLGEYIVQLRHERPGHILTPAVHLRRQDVGRLFHEKLGIPYTDDIPTLTDTARRLLREVFLTADVGISGVNFSVAETGTLCLVTNEGNGRMVTTLPPVHIALMGMERLVRSLDDLALMLSLLPRAATGQKLSVYTQLIHAPLPGQTRHLVLVDNGRTGIRNSPLRESLYCIRCGSCLNACPVFREIGGHAYNSPYSGPIGSVISAGFFGPDFIPLAQASSLCGACREACPVDIDLPKLLTRVRAGQLPVNSKQSNSGQSSVVNPQSSIENRQSKIVSHGLSGLGRLFLGMYSRIAPRPRLFAVSQRLAALGTRLISPFSDYVRLPAFTGWGYSKDLPRFAGRTFRSRWNSLRAETGKQVDRYSGKQVVEESLNEPATPDTSVLASLFTRELTNVSGSVIRTDKANLTDQVIDFLKRRGMNEVHLEPGVLDETALEQAGIAVRHEPDAALLVGVTKAICGIADSGSILVADGDGYPLQASLLPRVHIAVLCTSSLLPSLADALTLPALRQSRSAVVITGPSRTADIEMSLTIGMHGPGELLVFLVDD